MLLIVFKVCWDSVLRLCTLPVRHAGPIGHCPSVTRMFFTSKLGCADCVAAEQAATASTACKPTALRHADSS
jgi:hypothetical protein